MYLNYFGLDRDPFTISPDPAFLYPSPQHRQALAHLKYGLDREGGFILLTGEVGTGKTTLTRLLLEQLPGNIRVAYILNAKLKSQDVLASICQELSLDFSADLSIKSLTDIINRDLLAAHAQGKKTLLVIEEAQNLDPDVLETLRLLTNLETNTTKLLHILLVGQPELLDLISRNELRQLNQRVVSRFHIDPLSLSETSNYLSHRLRRAGSGKSLFDSAAVKQMYRISGGVPRMLNLLAERALLGAYSTNEKLVSAQMVRTASEEVFGSSLSASGSKKTGLVLSALLVVAVLASSWVYFQSAVVQDQKSGFGTAQTLPGVDSSMAAADSASLASSRLGLQSLAAADADIVDSSQNSSQTAEHNNEIDAEGSLNRSDADADAGVERGPADVGVDGEPAEIGIDEPTEQTALSAPNGNAFERLLGVWAVQAEVLNQDRLCQIARENALLCQSDEDLSVAELVEIDRPGLVLIPSDQDSLHLYLLHALTSEEVELVNSSGAITIPRSEFDQRWDGSLLYLWKPPAVYSGVLYPGSKNSAMVEWLQMQLARIFVDYEYIIGGGIYSDPIAAVVADFQSEQGLKADGLLGPRTLLRLMEQTELLPRLSASEF